VKDLKGMVVMRRRAAVLSFFLLTALAVGILSPVSATANTTVRTVFHIDSSESRDDLCPFSIDETLVGSFQRIDQFDNAGNPIKVTLTAFGGPFTITWSANGVTATTRSETVVVIFTFSPDGSVITRAQNGIVFNFVVPGEGSVLMEVGRLVRDDAGDLLFDAGPHQFLEGDLDALCAALSG
jgi:hypothetical protein